MAIVLGRKPGGSGGGGGAPSGPAGGVLSGTYPDPGFAADPVLESDYNANTVLKADSNDTPVALTMGASTILARLAAGNIVAATVAEIQALLGGQYLISESVAPVGGSASFDFTSIPGTFRHLRMVSVLWTENAAGQNLRLRANNDTGNNYAYQFVNSTGATVAGASAGGVSSWLIGNIPDTAEATPIYGTLDIPYYATAFPKAVLSYQGGGFDGGQRWIQTTATWTGTAAITRLTMFSEASDIKEGSRCALYGVY